MELPTLTICSAGPESKNTVAQIEKKADMSEEVYTKPPLVIAIKQLTVLPDPVKNIATIRDTAGEAKDRGARVLLLPEGIIARDPAVPD